MAATAAVDGDPLSPPDGATAHDDIGSLVEAVDAVEVCGPPATRREAVEAAADAGLPVLCGAPVAETAADAEAVARAVADVPFLAGHLVRFAPELSAIAESVDAGEPGDPGVVRVERRLPRTERSADWLADDAGTGSVLLDLAVHDVDFLRWVVGDVIRAFSRTRVADTSEHALTLLRFEGDAMAHLDTHRADLPDAPYRVAVEYAGDEGNIEFDSADAAAMTFHGIEGSGPDPFQELPFVDGHARDAHDYLLEHFRAVATGEADPRVGAEDAVATLRATLAAAESAETGRPVAPAEVGR